MKNKNCNTNKCIFSASPIVKVLEIIVSELTKITQKVGEIVKYLS